MAHARLLSCCFPLFFSSVCSAQPPGFGDWIYFSEPECGFIDDLFCSDLYTIETYPECEDWSCSPGTLFCDKKEIRPIPGETADVVSTSISYATDFKQHTTLGTYCEEFRLCETWCDQNGDCESDLLGSWVTWTDGYLLPLIDYDGWPSCPTSE